MKMNNIDNILNNVDNLKEDEKNNNKLNKILVQTTLLLGVILVLFDITIIYLIPSWILFILFLLKYFLIIKMTILDKKIKNIKKSDI